MARSDIQREAFLAATTARERGITQSAIAAALGISQSQVSRVLSGASQRRSRLFVEVCKYVYVSTSVETGDALKHHPELLEAVADVWDGTSTHAQALALVIRSLGALRSGRPATAAQAKRAD